MNRRSLLVLGYGITGQAVVTYCRLHSDFSISVLAKKAEWPSESLEGVTFIDQWPEKTPDLCLVSPGIPVNDHGYQQAKKQSVPLISELDYFMTQTTQPVIAITGSNGKSSVTHALGCWLPGAVAGGNLGPAALSCLRQQASTYVLEVSSFQLAHSQAFSPDLAVVLSISPDHLDWHGDFDAYVAAKTNWCQSAKKVLFNGEDPVLRAWAMAHPTVDVQWFYPSDLTRCPPGWQAWLRSQQAQQTHPHAGTLLSAIAHIADCMGYQATALPITPLPYLPHRCQYVGEYHGCHWYNDSKATNLAAAIGSLDQLSQQSEVIAIMGGQLKEPLAETLTLPKQVSTVIAFGQDGPQLAKHWQTQCETHLVTTCEQAVCRAKALSESGQTIVFAPGGASFDQFANYSERGEVFMQAVKHA